MWPMQATKAVFIYQGAPARFPLTVSLTGEGEVTSTPAGIACTAGECTHELEGEVTLTAKAAAGYEFAGWIGCRPTSATTCTVVRTAATEVTAVFLKAGREGVAGKAGATGNEGVPGPTGRKRRHRPASALRALPALPVNGAPRARSSS